MITGGAGFIGANFVHHWVDTHADDRVVVLDALTYAGNLASLDGVSSHPNFRFVHGDIVDSSLVEALIAEEKIDTIVHFAAESHVDRSISGPSAFIETNTVGTHNLLQAAKKAWVDAEDAPTSHRFHHVSTDEVYGMLDEDDPAFTELTAYAPNSPYAASKAASDHLVRAYNHTYGLETTTSNCSNNYGPYQFPEKLIPLVIVNALEGKTLPIYGDGSNIRDWLYVHDHVLGIESVIEHGSVGETYNIGGNEEHNNLEIVRAICERIDQLFESDSELAGRFSNSPAATGGKCESLIEFVKDRPGHDWRYAVDANKISSELSFEPKESFDSGLDKTVQWMLANEGWWRSVQDESYRTWIDRNYSNRFSGNG